MNSFTEIKCLHELWRKVHYPTLTSSVQNGKYDFDPHKDLS